MRVSELDGGDADRVGSRYRIAWRSRIPYELEFDFTVRKVDPPAAWRATPGDLTGSGRWLLFERDGVTAVLYEWHVEHDEALDEGGRAAGAARLRATTTTWSCAGAARGWRSRLGRATLLGGRLGQRVNRVQLLAQPVDQRVSGHQLVQHLEAGLVVVELGVVAAPEPTLARRERAARAPSRPCRRRRRRRRARPPGPPARVARPCAAHRPRSRGRRSPPPRASATFEPKRSSSSPWLASVSSSTSCRTPAATTSSE